MLACVTAPSPESDVTNFGPCTPLASPSGISEGPLLPSPQPPPARADSSASSHTARQQEQVFESDSDKWRRESERGIAEAKWAYAAVAEQHLLTEKLQRRTHGRRQVKLRAVSVELGRKLRSTQRMLRALAKRKIAIEEGLGQMDFCKRRLLQAEEHMNAPLELVETRIRARNEREESERITDGAQLKLEEERRMLQTGQGRLREAIEGCERLQHSLRTSLDEIVQDLSLKAEAWRIDDACWRSMPGYLQHTPPKNSLDDGPNSAVDGKTQDLLRRAQRKERLAAAFREQAGFLAAQVSRETADANKKAEQALTKRADEIHSLERNLEAKVRVMDEQLARNRIDIRRIAWERSNCQPQQMAAESLQATRQQRPEPERVEDEVGSAVLGQIKTLQRNNAELEKRRAEDEKALRHLENTRDALVADVDRKRRTLRIEEGLRMSPELPGVVRPASRAAARAATRAALTAP